jgi:hypothetical protein
LSHTAVEKYIEQHFGAPNVTCNNGADFTMHRNGATFTCSASNGRTFTVRIDNKTDGHYTVS